MPGAAVFAGAAAPVTARLASMLLADSRLPSGAYAHSAGLEAATLAGLGRDQVPGYLEARLRTVASLDAAAAVLAHRAASERPAVDVVLLARLERGLAARTPSAPMRSASRQLGRGLLRLATSLVPSDPGVLALLALRPDAAPFRAVALGVVGAALGLDEAGAASVVCYEEAQTIAAAALKLLPLDPAVSTGWVLGAAALVEQIVVAAVAVSSVEELPTLSAVQSEGWIQNHATERRRLFVS